MAYLSFDPWHLRENGRFEEISDEGLSLLVDDVCRSWHSWRKADSGKRKQCLKSLGDLLLEEKSEHALTITSEMGKVISQSEAEIEKCASLCFYYSENLELLMKPERRRSSAGESTVFFEPQGLILGIMPWNFPYWQALRFIVPVIAGGNAVILKHASCVPICAGNIESLFLRSGFPESLCRNVFARYDQVDYLLSRPEVRGVSVTGSNAAGQMIAGIAGEKLKKCVLELGGSDPFIVLDDADAEAAAGGALFSRFQNCGQSCIAAKRFFVQEKIFDQFLSLFAEKVERIITGDPYKRETFVGPMISDRALEDLERQVTMTVSMGARIITGGSRIAGKPAMYKPSVITDVPSGSPLAEEEVFGPAASVFRFRDTQDAVRMANSSIYGLGSSVWTGDVSRALRLAADLDSGTVAVNGYVRSDPALPFGGVKDSGFGRELSVEGFREFLNIKTVTVFR